MYLSIEMAGGAVKSEAEQRSCGGPTDRSRLLAHTSIGGAMLSEAAITTILQVRDGSAAVSFYQGRLGLHYLGRNSEGQELFSVGNGAALALMPSADVKPTGHTELSFEVADIVAEIGELTRRGVGVRRLRPARAEDGRPCLRARLAEGGVVRGSGRQRALPA